MKAISHLKYLKHIYHTYSIVLLRKYRMTMSKPVIYVFGDSHVTNLEHPLFLPKHVGPATAYRLGVKNSTTQANQQIEAALDGLITNKKNYLLFVFGEIDCRIHINKAVVTHKSSLAHVIGATVIAYMDYLREIKRKFPKSIIMVLNVLPAGEEKNIYNTKFYPSRELHKKIVTLFNVELEKKCKKYKFIYISVFKQLVDKNGDRLRDYVFDDIHFNKKVIPFIKDEIYLKTGLL